MKRRTGLKEMLQVAGFYWLHTATSLVVMGALVLIYFIGAENQNASIEAAVERAFDYTIENGNVIIILSNLLLMGVLLVFALRKKQSFFAYTGINFKIRSAKMSSMCVVAGLSSSIWFSFLLNSAIIPQEVFDNYGESSQSLTSGSAAIAVIALVVVAPIAEEIIYRGLIMRRLASIIPLGAAIVLQGILFGSAHGDPLWVLYATVAGCIIGFVTVRAGSVRAGILFHMAFNAGNYLFLAIANAVWGIRLAQSAVMVAFAVIMFWSLNSIDKNRIRLH